MRAGREEVESIMGQRIVVTGAGGFVAGSILRQVPAGAEVHALTRGDAIAELPGVTWHAANPLDGGAYNYLIEQIAPDAIIHTAANANIDYCQANQEEALEINARVTQRMADLATRLGARLIYCSTDNVFDGEKGLYDEDDPTSPVNFYGHTKVLGEEYVLRMPRGGVVARVAIVMGLPMLGVGNSFLSKMIPVLEKGEQLGVPPLEIRSPVDVATLGQALLELADHDFTGIIHLSGDDVVNRCEMVRRLAVGLGYPGELVVPNDPTVIPGRAARPINVALSNKRAHGVLTTALCGIEEGLRRVLELAPPLKET
jgi:dTDP-4-dehydrorhamnose reductase